MKKIIDILFSMTSSVILLFFFALSIGTATFIENRQGTDIARELVYNAVWFEFLLVLLVVNLAGNVFVYKIVNFKKITVLIFHLAFVVILIGAGITRYFGSEGVMHIREGESSDEISSDKTSVLIKAEYNGQTVNKSIETEFGENKKNNFSYNLEIGDRKISVENEMFMPNVAETIVPDEKGEPAISLFVMDNENNGNDFVLKKGDSGSFEHVLFSFEDSTVNPDIQFIRNESGIVFKSRLPIVKMGMMDQSQEMILPETINEAMPKTIYRTGNLLFVLKTFLPAARVSIIPVTASTDESGIIKKGKDALIFRVSDGNLIRKLNILSLTDEVWTPTACNLNGVKITVSYGFLPQKLPFKITLHDFILERYPGSNSPSSYTSLVTVTDSEKNTEMPYRIYMNNILKYRGYRFFQSSYDEDEQGTILSVSNDYWGTLITYIGYFLLIFGMILTMFNKNSRFRTVLKLSSELHKKRKGLIMLFIAVLFLLSGTIFASGITKTDHLKSLNSLLIQDAAQGRIEPFNTYASDLFRKINKGDVYRLMSAPEIIINMVTNPDEWQNEQMIKVNNDVLAKELGAVNGFVSYNQMFDFENDGAYRLEDKVDLIYRKNISQRNKYDKEVLNLDERVNICNEIFGGEIFLIFPDRSNPQDKWTSPVREPELNHNGSMQDMDSMTIPDEMKNQLSDEQLKIFQGKINTLSDTILKANENEKIFIDYLNALFEAYNTGNWNQAEAKLSLIKDNQQKYGGRNLPSKEKINMEILYNRLNIFGKLSIVYIIAGMLLLTVFLLDIFYSKPLFGKIQNWSLYFYLLFFAIYTSGLGIRWYISGHAPWSNGYETMIFVGWATALSGLIFSRRSEVTLSVTSILTAIALFVAGMSWMNPEITNLVPVLKSYWLIVHVAVITSSYGFLAMGALLAMLNLILMIFRKKTKSIKLSENIQEISYVIELSLMIGLIMLTAGCFIGGVWANESWGRYWGWDPKETWALVSILVYSAILHLRNVPKLNNQFVLSSLALIGFGSIIMTFFGVNYYLSGMHSYGQGTPPSIPSAVYIIVILILILIFAAYKAEKSNEKLK